jgi:MerR family transcriptional regulator, copper efflux regulator
MRIAEVSERSGFSPATLRYYEQLDLLPAPTRTAAGYRAYDESVLDRLAFIGRAKRLGCSLEEVAGLLPAWDERRCEPVQDGLRALAATKLDETRARASELAAYTADLERIVAGLGAHTPDGPCDASCGCVGEPPPACTLEAAALPGRLHELRDVMAHVTARTPVAGGIRFDLDAGTPLDRLAELMRAEQACCSFFAFALTVDGRGAALEVRGPAEGLALFA